MMVATLNIFDLVTNQTLNNCWSSDNSVAFSSSFCDSGLAVIAEAPSIDSIFIVDSEIVVGAARDVFDFVAWQAELSRYKCVQQIFFDYLPSKLELATCSPDVDVAFAI